MILTETELRSVISDIILEAWYHDLFGIDDAKSVGAKKRAKQNLDLMKKHISKGMSTDDALELVTTKNKEYYDASYPPTLDDKLDDLEEDHEEIEEMLYNSMTKSEKLKWLKQKSKRRQKKMKDGSYWSDMALKFN